MKAKIAKKVSFLMATLVLATFSFCTTASAAMIGSDSVSSSIYGTATTGNLTVYDTYAYATTSYSQSGSNISISASISAVEVYNGDNHQLFDYENTSGGGATARVEVSTDEYPNAVFLTVDGSHEVRNYKNGVLMFDGHWLDFTHWVR